jgi:hypothetical protein
LGTAHIAHHDLLIIIHDPAAEFMERILAPVRRSLVRSFACLG